MSWFNKTKIEIIERELRHALKKRRKYPHLTQTAIDKDSSKYSFYTRLSTFLEQELLLAKLEMADDVINLREKVNKCGKCDTKPELHHAEGYFQLICPVCGKRTKPSHVRMVAFHLWDNGQFSRFDK
jgi:hypothetical protein